MQNNKEGQLVSVIIPNFNRAGVIGQTLQSLINQTTNNWEAIVIDDGSTDTSIEVITKFCEQDTRFKLLHRVEAPKGAAHCRNIGLAAARGEFVLFLDSDDLLAPYCLAYRVAAFQARQQYDFVVGQGAIFSKKVMDAYAYWNLFRQDSDIDRFLSGDVVWSITGPLWRKEFLTIKGLHFNPSALSSQDLEFHIKALAKSPTYVKLEYYPDYFVRRDLDSAKNSISSTHYNRTKILNRFAVYRQLIQDLQRDNLTEQQLRRFARFFFHDFEVGLLKKEQLPLKEFSNGIKEVPKISLPIHLLLTSYLSMSQWLIPSYYTGYKALRKLFYIFEPELLSGKKSNYRTPIPVNEQEKLKSFLQTYNLNVEANISDSTL